LLGIATYGKANVGTTKIFFALLTFTEILCAPELNSNAENEEIRQKYPFFRKGLNYFEAK